MSDNWRETILKHLTSGTARVRVVADPDGLLLDEDLLEQLERSGFSVLLYEDPWMFRVRYEEDFRQAWDEGRTTPRLLVRSATMDLDGVPFDVFDQADPVYLSVTQLFSHLDRHAVAELDPRLFDRAFDVSRAVGSGRLNRRDSALRLLRDVYSVDPTLVQNTDDVWDLISRIYRSGYSLTELLAEVLVGELGRWEAELPVSIHDALTSRRSWELVLRQASQRGEMKAAARYWLERLGWDSQIGEHQAHISAALTRQLGEFLEQNQIVGRDWLQRAEDIAALRLATSIGLDNPDATMLDALDRRFEDWVYRDYGLLQSLPPYPEPVMVHHVVHYMAHQKDVIKWVLLVVDGMSYADWLYIRSLMDLSAYQVAERAVFAWVPTITSVSRKAIFSGRVPRDFGQSLGTTSGEENLWRRFWQSRKGTAASVGFQKTADAMDAAALLRAVNNDSPDILGLVANMVDSLAHSANMGMPQFLSDVKLWVTGEGGWLPRVIGGLVDQGFHVVLTSDHGHVPVEGIGRPPTGDIPDSKGQRVQVFPSTILRDQVATEWGMPWPHLSGLPNQYVPLLAPAHKAYANQGQKLLSHGGVSMEELIVPMIRIWR